MSVETGVPIGHLLGILFPLAAAYGTLAVIGGGLYLTHRRAARRRVERLIASLPPVSPVASSGHGGHAPEGERRR